MMPTFRKSLALLLMGAAVAGLASHVDAQTDDSSITVRLRPIGPGDTGRKALWTQLLNISKPVELHIEAGEPVPSAIARQCGSAPRDLTDFIAGLNPDKGGLVSPVARTWRSFPCPFWKFSTEEKPVTVPVKKGQVLTDVLPFHMGDSGPITVAAVRKLNPDTIDHAGVIEKDMELRLPYVIKSNTIGLNDALAGKPDEAIATVTAAVPGLAKDDVLQKILPTATAIYKHVAEDYPASEGDSNCAGPKENDVWPFDMAAALALMEREKAIREVQGPEAVVLLVDTGLDPSVGKSGMLWINKEPANARESVTDVVGDLNGANLVDSNGDISPTLNYPLSLHGTEVFAVMSGGFPDPAKVGPHLVVAGAKIVTSSPPVHIDRAALHESFRYAMQISRRNPSVILNLSVVTSEQIGGLVDALRATELLVVAAAGNNYDRVDTLKIYPPALSDFRGRLIVVGAHDWENKIADFSNRGMLVDLLAPGCKLKIRDPAGNLISVSGTSFAAPNVSVTAGMLGAMGLPSWQARNRIFASVDYDSRLVDVVATGGRLNVLNALRVHTDILELRDPETKQVVTYFGEIFRTTTWTCQTTLSAIPYRPAEMARVIADYPDAATKKVRLYTNPNLPGRLLDQPLCNRLEGDLAFMEEGTQRWVEVDWANVVNIIFAVPK